MTPISTAESHADAPIASAPDARIEELAEQIAHATPTNIVQSIRALKAPELQQAAQLLQQHFLYANLIQATTKQQILTETGQQFLLPAHFGRNLDALYDCLTDTLLHAGEQPGFIVVLEHIPTSERFNKEMREQLLDVFRDAAEFWAEKNIPFRCFYSFY
ncbi:Barstar (barnase inhibitor) [Lampropedia hyalina DSM 16112]|jgi:RNAse (barnase) inhibitor barstar|uniref:Barstar (Barnase inhibitor) n=1 Tax=Lampropedia hyalina DSM 16112 TaxID=1122156 RepID=A0A1M5CSV3_9BURK|nr:barstar family protein [Lampropedia hyalina]SHF57422.1 Barstar (barnase inhibitor) [Lampropedia hyalina DSM 16112]